MKRDDLVPGRWKLRPETADVAKGRNAAFR
jgi:hypothetical protein